MKNNFYFVGLGGQGIIKLSEIIAHYGMEIGEKVKYFKNVGLAQRGGSAHGEVRIGNVFGSRIPPFSADVIISMEFSETLKAIPFIKPEGIIILNDHKIYPIDMMAETEKYPKDEDVVNLLNKSKAKLVCINAASIAEEIKFPKAENIILLGVLAQLFSLEEKSLLKVLKKHVPDRFIDINLIAFYKGINIAKTISLNKKN